MGFWSKLFRKKRYQESGSEDWENIVYDRDDVDFTEEEERSRYIANCLEQIKEATKEIGLLTGEYSLITSYLTDMEEIEALPESEREGLDSIAGRLVALEQESKRYRGRKNRMKDADYYRLREHESEIKEGIAKLKECEEYGGKVKQDLQRLDRERHAYDGDLRDSLYHVHGDAGGASVCVPYGYPDRVSGGSGCGGSGGDSDLGEVYGRG